MEFNREIKEFNRLKKAMEGGLLPKGISPELLSLWDEVEKEQTDEKTKDTRKATRTPAKFNDNLWSKQWYMVSIN